MQITDAFLPSPPSKAFALAIRLGTGAMICSVVTGLYLLRKTDFHPAVNGQREPVCSEVQFAGSWTCIATIPGSDRSNTTCRISRQSHIYFDYDLSFEEKSGDFSAGGDWFFDQSAIVLRYAWQTNKHQIEYKPYTMRLVVREIDDSHFIGEDVNLNHVSHFRRIETVRFSPPAVAAPFGHGRMKKPPRNDPAGLVEIQILGRRLASSPSPGVGEQAKGADAEEGEGGGFGDCRDGEAVAGPIER